MCYVEQMIVIVVISGNEWQDILYGEILVNLIARVGYLRLIQSQSQAVNSDIYIFLSLSWGFQDGSVFHSGF